MDVEQRARELLAAAYEAEGFPRHAAKTRGGLKFTAVYEEVAMRALTAALTDSESDVGIPTSVPEGYVLVPVEPTKEMLDAGYGFDDGYPVNPFLYHAMIAARPEVKP